MVEISYTPALLYLVTSHKLTFLLFCSWAKLKFLLNCKICALITGWSVIHFDLITKLLWHLNDLLITYKFVQNLFKSLLIGWVLLIR